MNPDARYVKFRLYTGRVGSSLYIRVRIFDTKRQMLAALHAETRGFIRFPRTTRGVMAHTLTWTGPDYHRRLTSLIGTLNLCRPHLDIETVTHELTHVVFTWAMRKKILFDKRDLDAEEHICYCIGRLMRRYMQRAIQLGLYDLDLERDNLVSFKLRKPTPSK